MVGVMNKNTVCIVVCGNANLSKIRLIHKIGKITVKFTNIFALKMVIVFTGTEHIIHLLLPSRESDAEVVQQMQTNTETTNGITVSNTLIIPSASSCSIITSGK